MKRARLVEFPLRASAGAMTRPLWRALAADMAWQIDVGRVPAGSRVPSIRAAARQLGVSRNTVTWAFDALIADGYLIARVGDGTYVLEARHRDRSPVWRRRRCWLRDPDGLLMCVFVEA